MFTRDVNINIITTILILLQFEYSPALGTATTITCVSFVSLSFFFCRLMLMDGPRCVCFFS